MIRITINADTTQHARPFSTVGSASHEHIRGRGPGRQKRKLRLGGTDVGEETGPKPFSLWGRNGESCSQCPDPHGACLTFTAVTWLAWWGRQFPPHPRPSTILLIHCSASHTAQRVAQTFCSSSTEFAYFSVSQPHHSSEQSCLENHLHVHPHPRSSWRPLLVSEDAVLCTLHSSSSDPGRRHCCSPCDREKEPQAQRGSVISLWLNS